MQKINNSSTIFASVEKRLFALDERHSTSDLKGLANDINKIFKAANCKGVIYTLNTDKMFFGMRVYPNLTGDEALEMLGDKDTKPVESYYIEFDSKLFDPMLALDEKELMAILLHEIGHIVYDLNTIDEVRNAVNYYFSQTDDAIGLNATRSYKELIAYAMKDSIMKVGSVFSKISKDDEIIADSFVASLGYGPYLESAMKKIMRNNVYINKTVDNRLLTLSWVLRLNKEFHTKRIPAIHTLNKAIAMTGSELEKKDIRYALDLMNNINDIHEANVFDNVKDRFSKKIHTFKVKGINSVKNDIYELNLRLRCAESQDDLFFVIRAVNTDVAILTDYLSEVTDEVERQEIYNILQQLYEIRQKAAKDKKVHDRYSSYINVIYPE